MSEGPRGKMALFVCDDLVGPELASRLVPFLLALDIEPVLYDTRDKRNRKFATPPPEEVRFYSAGLHRQAIVPFFEGTEPALTPDGQPVEGLTYIYPHLAEVYGLEYHTVDDVNDRSFVEQIARDEALIGGLSARFLQIFETDILRVFQDKGFMWNLHSGLLPVYKGLLIPFWAAANGETEYGWTLHRIDRQIDTGDILDREIVALDPQASILAAYRSVIPSAVSMATDALRRHLQVGPLAGTPQTEREKRSYFQYPTAGQMQRLGVRYADPLEAVDYCAGTYTIPGTPKHTKFRDHLCNVVARWESRKTAGNDNARKPVAFYSPPYRQPHL